MLFLSSSFGTEFAVVPALARYEPGVPSSRLYIKNLARRVTAAALHRVYDGFVNPEHSADPVK
jgi:hypothetical protein